MLNMGSWDGWVVVPGIALPAPTQPYPPRVHLPHPCTPGYAAAPLAHRGNMVVGLISVAQLTLDDQISGFLTMTEVYNLLRIGRIINH